MFTKFNRVLLVSGLALGASALISPMAMAGSGGVAGSAAFTVTSGNVTGVATAAAVGMNGASAWSFNDGTSNSAGAIGTAGAITVDTFGAAGLTTVSDTVPTTYATQTNTLSGAPDIQLGSSSGDVIVNSP